MCKGIVYSKKCEKVHCKADRAAVKEQVRPNSFVYEHLTYRSMPILYAYTIIIFIMIIIFEKRSLQMMSFQKG